MRAPLRHAAIAGHDFPAEAYVASAAGTCINTDARNSLLQLAVATHIRDPSSSH